MKWLWLLGGFIPLWLAAMPVTGQVADREGKPIPQTRILGVEGLAYTDKGGVFKAQANADTLIFVKPGYKPAKLPAKAKMKVTLEPLVYNLPGVQVSAKRESVIGGRIIVPRTPDAADVIKLLPSQAGTGTAGEAITPALSGLPPRYTTLLVDGIPQNKQGEGADLSRLPAGELRNLEVIYGPDPTRAPHALAGSATINRRRPDEGLMWKSRGLYGSYGRYALGQSLAQSDTTIAWQADWTSSGAQNNFSCVHPYSGEHLTRKGNELQRQSAALHLWGQRDFYWKLGLDFAQTKRGLPGPLTESAKYHDAHLWDTVWQSNGQVGDSLLGGVWQGSYYAGYSTGDYSNKRSLLPAWRYATRQTSKKYGLDLQWQHPGWGTTGLHYDENALRFEQDPDSGSLSFDWESSHEAALWHRWDYARDCGENQLGASVSARLSRSDDDWQKCWRVEGSLTPPGPQPVLGVWLAHGWSPPSFFELKARGDLPLQLKNNLKSELATVGGLSLTGGWPLLQYSAQVQHSVVKNMIYWQRSPWGWGPGNLGRAKVTALMGDVNWQPMPDWRLAFSGQRNLAYDDSGAPYQGKVLTYTPAYLLNTGITWQPQQWELGLDYHKVGRQYYTRDHLQARFLPAYETVDARLGYTLRFIGWEWQLLARADNLLNNKSSVYPDTPAAGVIYTCGMYLTYKE